MTIHGGYPMEAQNPKTRTIAGRFFTNNAGAVDNTLNQGRGFSVARTGTGEFTITFDEKFQHLIAMTNGMQEEAGTLTHLQFEVYTPASRTLVCTIFTGGSAADHIYDANYSINFICVFQRSSVPVT